MGKTTLLPTESLNVALFRNTSLVKTKLLLKRTGLTKGGLNCWHQIGKGINLQSLVCPSKKFSLNSGSQAILKISRYPFDSDYLIPVNNACETITSMSSSKYDTCDSVLDLPRSCL